VPFALRPGAIIRDLNLRRAIYRQTAAFGHFGRPDLDQPWERTDRADALRKAAGLACESSTSQALAKALQTPWVKAQGGRVWLLIYRVPEVCLIR
jgi:hypothetical protein